MSVKVLTESIPVSNNVQLVMDRIAEILVYELANQRTLNPAEADSFDIRVYTDRFSPLDQFKKDKRSLVNIELSDDSMQSNVTAIHGKQQESVTINLYVYSVGTSTETADGHTPADLDAAVKVKQTRNIINRILKADINANLQFDTKEERSNIVNSVKIEAGQYLVPDFDNRDFGPVVAMRIALSCNIIEKPMINNGVPFESIVIDIEKDDTGLVYTTLEYSESYYADMLYNNDRYDAVSADYLETSENLIH